MKIKLTIKQKTKVKYIEHNDADFIIFEKQYLVITHKTTIVGSTKRRHSYYRLSTVLAVEEH